MNTVSDANDNDDEHNRWLSLRRRTLVAFCIISFALGFEYSLVFSSLLYYLKEVIKTQYAELCYGIALSSYPTSSIIGAFTIARFADRTKQTRRVIMFLVMCEITGNLLYAIPYSPLFPIFGRLIAGFGDVVNMVMCSEVVRCYTAEEVTSRISTMVVCFSVGFTLSPGMNIVFKYFDFHIGPVHIVYANMPGLFMAVCFVLLTFVAYFMVFDISREYDLKAQMEKQLLDRDGEKMEDIAEGNESNNDEHNINEQENGHFAFHWGDKHAKPDQSELKPLLSTAEDLQVENVKSLRIFRQDDGSERKTIMTSRSVLFTILTTFDLVLLLVFCFVCSYTLFGFDALVALIASNYFNFTATQTSAVYMILGALWGIVLLSLVKISTLVSDFKIIIFAVVVQILGVLTVLSLSLYHTNIYFNYVSLTLFLLASATAWCIEEVLTRSLFGKLVPSSCQSYAEGIRRSVSSVAFIISGVTTAGLFKYLTEIAAVLIVATVILLTLFVLRKKTLMNPVPLFFCQSNGEDFKEEKDIDEKDKEVKEQLLHP